MRQPTAIVCCIAVVFFISVSGLFAPVAAVASSDREQCLQAASQEAVAACRRALDTQPDDLTLLLKLGDHWLELKKIENAVAVFQKAAALFPKDKTALHKLEMAESLLKEQEWIAKRRQQSAEENVGAGQQARIRLNRIRCTSLKGSKGLKACDQVLAVQPDDHVLHDARGDILLQMGRIDDAKKAFYQALKLDPGNSDYSKKLAALGGIIPRAAAAKPRLPADNAGELKSSAGPTGSMPLEIIERMALLKSLKDQGLIDENEFQRRKTRLLDSAFQTARKKTDTSKAAAIASANWGQYHALVIGIQNYRHLTKLQSVRQDAAAVAEVLANLYGFKVQTLFDATRRQILLALGEYRRQLKQNDNLLIYYAGHGWLDEEADAGYWLPVDAATDNDVDWLSLNAVTSSVRAIPAKHVLIVADSCYSGKLTRGIHIKHKTADYLTRMAKKRARVVLSSGGLEPVADSGGAGGHSVFAAAFLKALQENQDIMDGTTLFTKIRRPVMLNAAQTPEYADIRKAGHEGGDFLFVPR